MTLDSSALVKSRQSNSSPFSRPVLVLLEGVHDIEFFTRLSKILSLSDPRIKSLRLLQQQGRVVMLPLGGNGPRPWVRQLTSLGKSSFLLFDRETPEESKNRRQAVEELNVLSNCYAFMTAKRTLENYLHPQAVIEAGGIPVRFGDDDHVAEIAAQSRLASLSVNCHWHQLSTRTRKRLRDKAKVWLNRSAVECMTTERVAERDPAGEVVGWLRRINELTSDQRLS